MVAKNAPQPPEKRTPWRILKRLPHLRFEAPILRPPNLDGLIIRLRSEELADGVPADALHETLVEVEFLETFCVGRMKENQQIRQKPAVAGKAELKVYEGMCGKRRGKYGDLW